MTHKKLRLSRRHLLFDLEESVPSMFSWGRLFDFYIIKVQFQKLDEDLEQLSSEISFSEQNNRYEKTFNEQ